MATNRLTVASLAARFDDHVEQQERTNVAIIDALTTLTRTVDAMAASLAPVTREIVEPKAAPVVTPKAPAKARAPRKPKAPVTPKATVPVTRSAKSSANVELAAWLVAQGLPKTGAVWVLAKSGIRNVESLRAAA